MPNQTEFLILNPAQGGHINLKLGPKQFLGQFVAAHIPEDLPDPGTLSGTVKLIAAALDSGHGGNAAPMPKLSRLNRLKLHYHVLVQRLMVTSLLSRSKAGWCRAPFVKHLEKSMRTSNAFLLGMLYARVSTDHWAKVNGWGTVARFWHYSVLESSASNFNAVTAASKAGNPDFLVQFSNGDWACVEAKGTLDGFDEVKLREGMRQACKISLVSWRSPGANSISAVPCLQACSLAYFDASQKDTLEVYHLDPPLAIGRAAKLCRSLFGFLNPATSLHGSVPSTNSMQSSKGPIFNGPMRYPKATSGGRRLVLTSPYG